MSEPLYAYTVAVVGDGSVMSAGQLRALIEVLVNRYRDNRRIILVSAGGGSPELGWCKEINWTLMLEPELRSQFKQDCALVAVADAVVVIGDPAPWQRLLKLAREAGTPTRVYREPVKVKPRTYDACWRRTQ